MFFLHGTFLRLRGRSELFVWAEEGRDNPEVAAGVHPWAVGAGRLFQIFTGMKELFPDFEALFSEPKFSPGSSKSEEPTPKRRGRKPKKPANAENSFNDEQPSAPFRSLFVTLPTLDGLPLPSSFLIADAPAGAGTDKNALRPRAWRVEGMAFAPREAVLFLASLLNLTLLAANSSGALPSENVAFRLAPDLEFCLGLLRFGGALAARQNFLPSIKKLPDGTAYAVWQPVFAGLERDRREALIRSVPALCRAVTESDPEAGRGGETPSSQSSAKPSSSPQSFDSPDFPCVFPSSRRFVLESLDFLTDAIVRFGQPQRSGRSAEEFVHQEWIARLSTLDPSPCDALAELEPHLNTWRRPIAAMADAPYRLCLQLEEPGKDLDEAAAEVPVAAVLSTDAEWRLACYVQPLDDPTLQVGTGRIFSPGTKQDRESLKLLTRGAIKPQEFAVQALGQAGKLFSPIEASLRGVAPSGCPLSSEDAFRFLERDAAPLIEAGFVVRFPSWWTARGYRKLFGLKVSVAGASKKFAAKGKFSLGDILNVDWDLMLDGVPVTLKELERLAAMKDTMVRVRGRWIAMSQDELKKALNFLKKAPSQATAREVLRASLGVDGDFAPEGVTFAGERAFTEMLETLTGRADADRIPLLPVPPGLTANLRPYQTRGFSWLAFLGRWGLGACLADDMGLGKTLQTLTLIQNRVDEGETRPTLLVAPTSVLENWRREAERFLPGLRVLVHHGAKRAKSEDFVTEAERNDVVATSFALLVRDHATLSRVRWSGVVLDEAQNVKNPASKQAKAAGQLASEYRVALTGTPVENHVGDLWSLMEFLNPGLLGTPAVFKRRFFNPIQKERNAEAAARLKNITGPFVLRRLKTDRTIIDDLPEKIVTKTFCRLKKEQATLYAAVTKEAERVLEESEGIQRKGLVLATLTRLKQICNHPAQYLGERSPVGGRSGKLERLEELAAEALDVGDRMLIFTQYAEMGEILKRRLQESLGEETFFLHGGVPKAQRDAMVARFQEDDGARLFVLSLKAGGTGLNLTRANHVVLFDRWWNPAVEQQAIDRAFRIGQKKNVQVHAFVCQGTLEERIDEMIETKREIADMTVKSGERWLTELSTAELKDLFTLRRTALAGE